MLLVYLLRKFATSYNAHIKCDFEFKTHDATQEHKK